jgi:Mrp family chromosome partitioning ATPase
MVLGKVIDALNLTKDPNFTFRQKGFLTRLKNLRFSEPPQLVDDDSYAFVQALGALRNSVDVARVGASHIVRIDVKSTDPRKATKIANEITRVYLEERRSGSTGEVRAIRELYRGLGPSAFVVSEVQPPVRPSGMPNFVIVLGAMLLGIGAGSVAAVLLDVLSNRIRNPEQIEYFLGLSCLGVLPFVSGNSGTRNPAVVGALGRLTALLREEGGGTLRSLGVTSVMPGDGATTVAVNLAQSMSRSGHTVLLVEVVPPELLKASSEQDNRADDPTYEGTDAFDRRLVSLDALEGMLRDAARSYDFVIADMPSLASSADARVAARTLDGLLLVVRWNATDCVLASQALHSAAEGQTKFVGAVLNMADPRAAQAHGNRPPLPSRSSARESRGTPPTGRAHCDTKSSNSTSLVEPV